MKKAIFKIGCAVLVLLMLCTTSCKKEEPEPIPASEPLDLGGYSLIRPDKTSSDVINASADLYEVLSEFLDTAPTFSSDFLKSGENADSGKKEILVGNTNRPETAEVLATLGAGEFAVKAVGNKLVLVGFTEAFTPQAVTYFADTYLKADTEIPSDLNYIGKCDAVTLVDGGSPVYRLVRAQYSTDSALDGMLRIAEELETLGSDTVSVKTDSGTHDAETLEILVGATSYDEFNKLKETCSPDTYGIYYVGNKIILFGWTDEDLTSAVDAFIEGFAYAKHTDAEGKVSISYPKVNKVLQNDAGYYKDLPVSAGGEYYDGVFNCSDNTVQLYWKNVKADTFEAYGDELTKLGFSVYQSNKFNSVYSATYRKDNTQVHVYWLKNLSEMRVTAQENATFPILPYEYTKVCDVSVTQLGLDYSDSDNVGGMGYVILLEDGTFAVIDGGYPDSADAENLYKLLQSLKPDGVEDIVIRTWFLTHGDHDHYGVLSDFIKNYSDKVKVEYLVSNDVSDYLYSKSDHPTRSFAPSSVNGKFGGCRYQKAHTGQQYCLAGVTFTILFTQEDTGTSSPYEIYNSYSMVFDAVTNDTRFVWFGDTQRESALRIKAMYYEDLKCDVMQVAHHGVNGGSTELYMLCNPTRAFFPTSENLYKSVANLEQNKYITTGCEKVFFAFNGTQTISFAKAVDYGTLDGRQDDSRYSKFY